MLAFISMLMHINLHYGALLVGSTFVPRNTGPIGRAIPFATLVVRSTLVPSLIQRANEAHVSGCSGSQ